MSKSVEHNHLTLTTSDTST